ncbi:MAG: ribose-5-phosphate isomerase RpiA [Ignisphaera sp.]|uniref:Ribose 5-phosphate isomerase A n=1 Tax=Ignisphaera aggregans TaxID=334771 RepID=A0A7C4JJF1_9CREN
MVDPVLEAKKKAVEESIKIVLDYKRDIVGIGTGSTVDLFIDLLTISSHLFIESYFVCASMYTAKRLSEAGFKVLSISDVDVVDVYIDGADEVDPELNLVKGRGGASTLEKILASAANSRIYMVDFTKLVKRLGEKHAIPIEVLSQALSIVYRKLREKGFSVQIRKSKEGKYGFITTDTGGILLDVIVPQNYDPFELNREIKSIPGVIETGIFTKDLVDVVVIGYPDKVVISRKLI